MAKNDMSVPVRWRLDTLRELVDSAYELCHNGEQLHPRYQEYVAAKSELERFEKVVLEWSRRFV